MVAELESEVGCILLTITGPEGFPLCHKIKLSKTP